MIIKLNFNPNRLTTCTNAFDYHEPNSLVIKSHLKATQLMASFDDYDEFGNYIGADLASDEEEDFDQGTFASAAQQARTVPAPLEGFDDGPIEDESMALMEVDG